MKRISGTWQNVDGSPVAGGRVFFKLSNDAVAQGSTQVSTGLIFFTLDSTGSLPSTAQIWANDELQPSGTTYTVAVVAAGGGLVWGSENLGLSGISPININTAVPNAAGVTFSGAVLLNPLGGVLQTIAGPLTISGNVIATGTLGVTGAATFSAGIFGPGIHSQLATTGPFTIPAGVTQLKVTMVGGGGAGGGSAGAAATPGGGGAGGATAVKYLSGLTPGLTITVTVGTGGTGVSNGNGNSGTASSIASGTQTIATVTAPGGGGGGSSANGAFGGGGFAPTGQDAGSIGSPGQNGAGGTNSSGAGGGGYLGGGGAPSIIAAAGVTALTAGAGGSGAGGNAGANVAGGNGAQGVVQFEWIS